MREVKLLLLDVDGVLTDGGLYLDDQGKQTKRFFVRDGLAIRLAMDAGLQVAFLTGKTSGVVAERAKELGVTLLIQGSGDKGADARTLAEKAGVSLSETAHMGDDLIDLPALRVVGYPMCVSDAAPEVQQFVRGQQGFIGTVQPGYGAVREAIEHLLKTQGLWQSVIAKF